MSITEPVIADTLRIDKIETALAESGYCWVRQETSADEFRDACEALGEIIYEADVRMGGERPRNYQLPAAIDFHNDHVSAEIAAWRCVEAEPDAGAMLLLDLAPICNLLEPSEREALARVGIADNAAWGGGAPVPLALPAGKGFRFHYVPWLQKFPQDAAAGAALEKFEFAVREAIETQAIEIDVAPGHCVFVENHRVMHGRGAISTNSPRYLKRFWVRRADTCSGVA